MRRELQTGGDDDEASLISSAFEPARSSGPLGRAPALTTWCGVIGSSASTLSLR